MREIRNNLTKDSANESTLTDDGFSEEMLVLGQTYGRPARTYKDRVFRMLLKERENALEVYNAINGTHYGNPDDLTITTLENAVYLGMKNDISFIIYDQLMLFEHQSTENPNLPLRDLFYVACVYSRLTYKENLYGTKLVRIPEPRFIVFYNGKAMLPEQSELKLSDAYENASGDAALELKVQVLNINQGYNQKLIEKSPALRGYMLFVDAVRRYEKTLPFPQAVEAAINECISNGILEKFLKENRAEVLKVSIFEYDEEKHLQQEREEAIKLGEERINRLIIKLSEAGRTGDILKAASDADYQDKLIKEFNL